MNNNKNTKNNIISKQNLLDNYNKKTGCNLQDSDVKYVIINFSGLIWCKFNDLGCIFSKHDTFEEFNDGLIEILLKHYPKEAITISNIGYSKCLVVDEHVPEKRYSGSIFDCVEDNDTLFVSWIQRTEWRALFLGAKPE